jgi:hypothetical protein
MQAVPWTRVDVSGDGRTLFVVYTGGQIGGACGTLGKVDLVQSPSDVRIGLQLGNRSASDLCSLVGVVQATAITLDAPLGDRAVIDTATGARPPLAKP